MELIHNPRCSKSRQAKQLLEEKGIAFEVREYLTDELSEEELTSILIKLGKSPQEILRKGEAIFKEEFKGKDLSDQEWIKAMVENPKLIERPILINGEKAVVGRPPEDVLRIV
ncbi:MAG: arsenate reductase (glutaredoxin) [Crocinitomicaceae bacterium]|nr:arsenate reductase (glutaredoxin) [Crocinitomicaceae bacterium]